MAESSNSTDNSSNDTNANSDRITNTTKNQITHISINNELFPIKSFKEFIIKDGETMMFNPDKGIAIPFSIDVPEDVEFFGINNLQIMQIRQQLERLKENNDHPVPNEFKHKFCAIFAGKVQLSFDTREELDAFRKSDEAAYILYTWYYADTHK